MADDILSIATFNSIGSLTDRQQLKTTHLRVWSGSQLLLVWLRRHASTLHASQPRIHFMELGSGTGWLMLSLAATLPEAHVTLTEQPRAVPALQANVDRVLAKRPDLANRVSVRPLRWQDAAAISFDSFDVLVCCEVLYSLETLEALPTAIVALLSASRGARCVYAHTPRRKQLVDERWRQAFEHAGLAVCAVDDDASDASTVDAAAAVGDAAAEEDDGEWAPPDGGLFAAEDAHARSDPERAQFAIHWVSLAQPAASKQSAKPRAAAASAHSGTPPRTTATMSFLEAVATRAVDATTRRR